MEKEKLYAYAYAEQEDEEQEKVEDNLNDFHDDRTLAKDTNITVKESKYKNTEKISCSCQINPDEQEFNKGDFYTYTQKFDVRQIKDSAMTQKISIVPSSIKATRVTFNNKEKIEYDVKVSDDLQSFSLLVPDETEVEVTYDIEIDYRGEKQIAYTRKAKAIDDNGKTICSVTDSEIRKNPFTLKEIAKKDKPIVDNSDVVQGVKKFMLCSFITLLLLVGVLYYFPTSQTWEKIILLLLAPITIVVFVVFIFDDDLYV